MSLTTPAPFYGSLLSPQGSHGSASGNANANKANASLISRLNLSDSFNLRLFSPQTHKTVVIMPTPPPPPKEEQWSETLLGRLVGLGAATILGAAVGAVIAWRLGKGENGKETHKGRGGK